MTTAFIGLGANLGDRLATMQSAVDSLAKYGTVDAISPVFETEPWGYAEQPRFLNAVVSLRTDLGAGELLATLLGIEQELGRTRSFVNAPRTIDLDLLLYGDTQIDGPNLTVPHPRLHERAFVLVPLACIAPNVVHPRLERTIKVLLDDLESTTVVAPFDGELRVTDSADDAKMPPGVQ